MKRHKYNAIRTEVNGIMFDSKKEARCYSELLILKRAKEITSIELQPVFILQEGFKKNGVTYRAITYRADFLIMFQNGSIEIWDCKGMKTDVYKIKRKLFEKKYPDLTIKEV